MQSPLLEMTTQAIPIFLRKLRDPQRLIQQYELPADAASLTELRLPLSRLWELAEACAVEANDPHLGISVAEGMVRGTFGLLEFVSSTAPTVRESFHQLNRFTRLLNPLIEITLEQRDGEALVTHSIPGQPRCVGRQCNEYSLGSIISTARGLLGADWGPRRIWFANAAPASNDRLVSFFRTRALRFDAGSNGFAFDAALLDEALPTRDDALQSVLARQAENVLEKRPRRSDLLGRVREEILAGLPRSARNVEEVARKVRMSPRTLQRRLQEEGSGFQALLDDVRRQLAAAELMDESIPLSELAFKLGYSDLRAFVRAYRRWHGTTPGAARQALRASSHRSP